LLQQAAVLLLELHLLMVLGYVEYQVLVLPFLAHQILALEFKQQPQVDQVLFLHQLLELDRDLVLILEQVLFQLA
jgi:hypothetical protein